MVNRLRAPRAKTCGSWSVPRRSSSAPCCDTIERIWSMPGTPQSNASASVCIPLISAHNVGRQTMARGIYWGFSVPLAKLAASRDDEMMSILRHSALAIPLAIAASIVTSSATAATIEITPTDNYSKIESAKAGDEVIIDPGTYTFRVYITAAAPSNKPVVIHAKDPQNPPVWDLSAGNVEDAPGSYTAGDRGRGCWQFSGATNVTIESIVFTGCHTASFNSAGIRYYETTTGLLIRDCLFKDNDDGLTGGTQNSEATVEFSEFDSNGNLNASSGSPTHNIYIYGGKFTLRYSYLHDPIQAQNFHIRATEALIESNWIEHGK